MSASPVHDGLAHKFSAAWTPRWRSGCLGEESSKTATERMVAGESAILDTTREATRVMGAASLWRSAKRTIRMRFKFFRPDRSYMRSSSPQGDSNMFVCATLILPDERMDAFRAAAIRTAPPAISLRARTEI